MELSEHLEQARISQMQHLAEIQRLRDVCKEMVELLEDSYTIEPEIVAKARTALADTEPSVCKWRHAGRAIYTCQSHEGVMDGVMWDFCPWCGRPLVVEEVVDE